MMRKRQIRLGHASAIGIVIGLILSVTFWIYTQNRHVESRPLEEALWVCDWEITKIYGPGTPEQASIVKQLRMGWIGDREFKAPILYRMGGSSSRHPSEGILMDPFDPSDPESALLLSRKRLSQSETK